MYVCCVRLYAAGGGVLRSGVLPVVRQVGLDQNSYQGDDRNWQRETWCKWKKGNGVALYIIVKFGISQSI